MNDKAPFLDVSSFVMEGVRSDVHETPAPPSSPFLSLYESEESGELIDPEAEAKVAFLNELYNEEFDEALFGLVSEAAALYETRFVHELGGPRAPGYEAERFLNQHFAPLVAEVQTMLATLANELSRRDPNTLTEDEINTIVDRYQPSIELTPSFEEFWGKLKNVVKTVAKAAGKFLPIGVILGKLQPLIKPLLQKVIQNAIGKLPLHLQPIAQKLGERLGFLEKPPEEGVGAVSDPAAPATEPAAEPAAPSGVAEIQYEFNQHVANLLFAHTEVEQDLEVARVLTDQQAPDTYPLAELDRARDQFVENLRGLKEGEDPTPHVENFLPLVLPVLRIGIRLVGRGKVVNFLAKLLGKLIQKFVGPQYAPALSQAIVDAGLRLLNMEATADDESRAAASAVAATVEETVRRVAALPDYVLDNQELLEGYALEAFERAAAANLPRVLPEATYRKRPGLGEARKLRGTWCTMPCRGRRGRYKKYSRIPKIRITPHKVSAIETFGGVSLEDFLEEKLGLEPGEEFEANVHLYESNAGARLPDIARLEENTPGLGTQDGYEQLHPLTREAAGLLVGEPDMGREVDSQYGTDPHAATVGQRFYYLEIPGKRPLTIPEPAGRAKGRRSTGVRLILDFPKNEIHVYVFLGEIRAQEIAVKLRQHAHIGMVTARLQGIIQRGLRRALTGTFGRLKIVHEAVTPDQWAGALRRLPSLATQVLLGRLQEWVLKGLSDHLKQHTEEFIKAAEDTADGVTLVITIGNPPGFPQLRQALKGKGLPLASLKMSDGVPTVKIRIAPGYSHE